MFNNSVGAGRRLFRQLCLLMAGLLCAIPLALGSSTPAFAATNTVSASAGPVSVPGVPLQVCVNTTCIETTPAAATVSLDITATAAIADNQLTATSSSCPEGQEGVAITVTATLDDTVTIDGEATVTLTTGMTITVPISQSQDISAGPRGVVVSVCTF
jgi:hypothetical protein